MMKLINMENVTLLKEERVAGYDSYGNPKTVKSKEEAKAYVGINPYSTSTKTTDFGVEGTLDIVLHFPQEYSINDMTMFIVRGRIYSSVSIASPTPLMFPVSLQPALTTVRARLIEPGAKVEESDYNGTE